MGIQRFNVMEGEQIDININNTLFEICIIGKFILVGEFLLFFMRIYLNFQ